jgi:AraC family transcriptional regulator
MNAPRLLIESSFSLELRTLQRSTFELPALPDYLVVYLLDSKLAQFATGTLLLVNPNSGCKLEQNRGRTEWLLVRLAPQFLVETATRLRLYRLSSQLLFRQPLQPLSDARLQTTLAAIASELAGGAAGWREVIAASVNQLAVYLLRNHVNVQRSAEVELSRVGIVDRRLRRAVEFMHDNCGRELSLHEIANAAYLSEFHFARLFKKLTGATPHAYLAALRVERARRLLAETDLAISEIGARVGYASQSHFTKIFREATGLTPKTFRAALKSN